jgi:hypothetical protein
MENRERGGAPLNPMHCKNHLVGAIARLGAAFVLAAAAIGTHASGLSFDSKGNLFVSDEGSDSIYKLTPEGKKSTFASGIHGCLAFDRSGDLFVYDYIKDPIFKIAPDGAKSIFTTGRVSPDKQWEYLCSDVGQGRRTV